MSHPGNGMAHVFYRRQKPGFTVTGKPRNRRFQAVNIPGCPAGFGRRALLNIAVCVCGKGHAPAIARNFRKCVPAIETDPGTGRIRITDGKRPAGIYDKIADPDDILRTGANGTVTSGTGVAVGGHAANIQRIQVVGSEIERAGSFAIRAIRSRIIQRIATYRSRQFGFVTVGKQGGKCQ